MGCRGAPSLTALQGDLQAGTKVMLAQGTISAFISPLGPNDSEIQSLSTYVVDLAALG